MLEKSIKILEDTVTQALKCERSTAGSDSATKNGAAPIDLSAILQEIKQVKSDVQELRADIDNLYKEINYQEDRLDDMEQYSRRNCLLLHGLPETPNEDSTSAALDVLGSKLGIQIDISAIDRCHRVGAMRKTRTAAAAVKEGPRPLIIKFVSYRNRDAVWKNKKNLKGTRLLITESLTKKRQNLLRRAKEMFGVRNCWTSDGRIVIFNGRQKHVVTTENELVYLRRTNTEA